MEEDKKSVAVGVVNGFSPVSSTPVFWKSRKRSTSMKNLDKDITDDTADKTAENKENSTDDKMEETTPPPTVLSEKRKALFEPLEPIMDLNGRAASSAESLLPPPDFDSASYPRGWLIGKKRKLVNVDVVESMRRIAVQEMNRKDREIDGLNEQLEEDSRVLEHLQVQLLDERSKRADVERQNALLKNQVDMFISMSTWFFNNAFCADVERQNALLKNQVDMLMNMLQEPENMDDEEDPQDPSN